MGILFILLIKFKQSINFIRNYKIYFLIIEFRAKLCNDRLNHSLIIFIDCVLTFGTCSKRLLIVKNLECKTKERHEFKGMQISYFVEVMNLKNVRRNEFKEFKTKGRHEYKEFYIYGITYIKLFKFYKTGK